MPEGINLWVHMHQPIMSSLNILGQNSTRCSVVLTFVCFQFDVDCVQMDGIRQLVNYYINNNIYLLAFPISSQCPLSAARTSLSLPSMDPHPFLIQQLLQFCTWGLYFWASAGKLNTYLFWIVAISFVAWEYKQNLEQWKAGDHQPIKLVTCLYYFVATSSAMFLCICTC